ncbi:MAG: hypothetical protein Q8P56_02105 [Candidatus Uhrbacteria bacterium]|nr:hypothetical protein [Candidatus Uhrbacteria bacterium]
MIRISAQKRCAAGVGASIISFFSGTPLVFAQGSATVTAQVVTPTDANAALAAMLANPATLAAFGGFFLIVLAISFLIVFLVSPKDFPRKEFLGTAWPLIKKYLWFFIGIMIFQQIFVQIPTFLTALIQSAMNLSNDEPISSNANFIVSFVLGIIIQSGFIAMALHVIDGAAPRFADLFSQFSIFFRYLGASILYGLMLFVGFILLIVPGVYLMLTYAFWPYFLVDKKVSIIESFKMSAQVTKGHKGSLLLLYVFIMALNILGLCVLFIGVLITAPLTALILAYAYRKLTNSLPPAASGATPATV